MVDTATTCLVLEPCEEVENLGLAEVEVLRVLLLLLLLLLSCWFLD